MKALAGASRWIYASSVKMEVVSTKDSHTIEARTRPTRRPTVTINTSKPKSTSRHRQINYPAAHEVGGVNWYNSSFLYHLDMKLTGVTIKLN